jgi:AraC-like DNA-binding protein
MKNIINTKSVCRLGRNLEAQLRCGIGRRSGGSTEEGFITGQYAVVYIAEGAGRYFDKTSGRFFEFKAGYFFQRFPNREHSVYFDEDTENCYLAIPGYFYELMNIVAPEILEKPVHCTGYSEQIITRFQQIITDLETRNESELFKVLKDMQDLIFLLYSMVRDRENALTDNRDMRQAELILASNLEQHFKLEDVAVRLNMSYSSFRKKFIGFAGVAPGDYRIRRRIEKAMELLSSHSMSVSEIADALGYSDIYIFSAQFKKFTGLSPSAFRKQPVG